MIFVISYDRRSGRAEWLAEYPDSEMGCAQQHRLEVELEALAANESPEIVVLSAESKAQVLKTHAKYFGRQTLEDSLKASLQQARETRQ
jgi:hypothetical protein